MHMLGVRMIGLEVSRLVGEMSPLAVNSKLFLVTGKSLRCEEKKRKKEKSSLLFLVVSVVVD